MLRQTIILTLVFGACELLDNGSLAFAISPTRCVPLAQEPMILFLPE